MHASWRNQKYAPFAFSHRVESLSFDSSWEAESLSLKHPLLSTSLMSTIKPVLTEDYVAPFF